MKKVIVTGATGFIGTHLCRELDKNGIEVTGLARKDSVYINRIPDSVKIHWCGMDEYDDYSGESACVSNYFL